MPPVRLDQRRAGTLRPRRTAYDIRDRDLKGFGIRVAPSGRKTWFVHVQRDGERIWRTIGDAGTVVASEARARAMELLAVPSSDGAVPEGTVLEAVAEDMFRHRARHWKPGTLEVNRAYYRSRILPRFRGRPVAGITRGEVRQWFASLAAVPGAANRAAPVLSVIMRRAEELGLRPEGTNPCRGIVRYRRPARERFLSDAELHRLSEILERERGTRTMTVAALRLLVLTGCRKTEVRTLRWTDYREGRLFLRDGKTGPRTVWLSSAARAVLDALPRGTVWVLPNARGDGPVSEWELDRFWRHVRTKAGLGGVRLHDLRHTYASMAIRHGETIPTTGRLLGHLNATTTLRYAHAGAGALRGAAETLGAVLGGR